MGKKEEDRRAWAATAAQQAKAEEVVAVQRDGRGRVVALQLARGDRVTAATGYWTTYVDRFAYFIRSPGSGERAYIQVLSPTVADGPYFIIRREDAANDNLERLPECEWPDADSADGPSSA
jgi:glycine/D-amino acid oxidase-like deaminating enzyme